MITKFEELLRCEYASEATLKTYLHIVRKFLAFKGSEEPEAEVRRYLLSLEGRDAKTVNLHRCAILKFYKLTEGAVLGGAVPKRKESKKIPKVLGADTVLAAIRGVENPKHRLAMRLLYSCGLRLHELLWLRKSNVDTKKHLLQLEDTKGQKHRIVPVPPSLRPDLYAHVEASDDLLFTQMSSRGVEEIVAKAFKKVGAHASPHMLRHSFATDQLSSGQNIAKVQAWLGHSDIKTTMVYLHLSEAQLSTSTDLLSVDDLL